MTSPLLVLILGVSVVLCQLPDACSSTFVMKGFEYDVGRMARPAGDAYLVKTALSLDENEDQYTFSLNVCGEVSCTRGHLEGVSAGACQTWVKDGFKHQRNMGRLQRMSFEERDDGPGSGFVVIYEDGDLCHGKYNRSVEINVICDPHFELEHEEEGEGAYALEFLGETDECKYRFGLKNLFGCPAKNDNKPVTPEPEASGTSAGTVILIIVLVFVFVYLVGGILFNYFKNGARGIEVVPNLDFWVMVFTCNGRIGGGSSGEGGPAGITALRRGKEGFNLYNDNI